MAPLIPAKTHPTGPVADIPPQRARGRAELVFGQNGVRRLYQDGCAKLRLPRRFDRMQEAIYINSSGGVTGGDDLSLSVTLGAGARLCVTTQTAERIYRSAQGCGQIRNTLRLGTAARLDWLPQETILFDHAALARRLAVDLAHDAVFLGVESLILGRTAMGEAADTLFLRDNWRIQRAGRLIWADGLRLDLPEPCASGPAGLADARALATVLYVAPNAEARLNEIRQVIAPMACGTLGLAVSAWNGMMLLRLMARDAQALRHALIGIITAIRGVDVPRVWRI